MPRPIVLVDTTEFHEHPLLDGSGWPKLLARSKRGEVQLAVSIVTIREAERQVSEKLNKVTERLSGLERLGVDSSVSDQLTAEADLARDRYRSATVRRVESSGGVVLDLPSIGLEKLLDRDLAARKPFNRDGKGFRDSLIWLSFVEHLSRIVGADDERPVWLVTGNRSDFGEGNLHSELGSDLDSRIASNTTVVTGMDKLHRLLDDYFRELDDARLHMVVAERQIPPEEPTLGEVVNTALLNAAEDLVGKSVADRDLDDLGRTTGIDLGDVMPPEMTDAVVTSIYVDEASGGFDVIEEYEGDTLLIAAAIDIELIVEGMIPKADFYVLDDDHLTVTDWDVNDHVMSVEFTTPVRATFNVTLIGASIENVELDYVTDISSTVRPGWFVTFTDGMYETSTAPDGHYATAVARVQAVRLGAAHLDWLDNAELPTEVRVTILEADHLRLIRDGITVRTPNSGLRTHHGGSVTGPGWNYHPSDPRPWVRVHFTELDGEQRLRFESEAHTTAAAGI